MVKFGRFPRLGRRHSGAECCDDMAAHLNQSCDMHSNPWDCADAVIVRSKQGEYGLPVRDGENASASSFILISHCPWCGKQV